MIRSDEIFWTQSLSPHNKCTAGRLSLSFDEPLSLRRTTTSAVQNAITAALATELPSSSGGAANSSAAPSTPWRPRGILVSPASAPLLCLHRKFIIWSDPNWKSDTITDSEREIHNESDRLIAEAVIGGYS